MFVAVPGSIEFQTLVSTATVEDSGAAKESMGSVGAVRSGARSDQSRNESGKQRDGVERMMRRWGRVKTGIFK